MILLRGGGSTEGVAVFDPDPVADLGGASGNGKGQIFVRGEVIKTVPEHLITETLIEEALRLAGRTQS